MTIEERKLLLKDLCYRSPYNVIIYIIGIGNKVLNYIDLEDEFVNCAPLETIRPYLRPMSSMTEEEFEKLKEYSGLKYEQLDLASYQNGTHKCLDFYLSEVPSYVVILVFDWLNKNMFDYRGLITIGLALEAPEEMY